MNGAAGHSGLGSNAKAGVENPLQWQVVVAKETFFLLSSLPINPQ